MWGDLMEPLVSPEVENLEAVWAVIKDSFARFVALTDKYVTLQIALLLGILITAVDLVLFLQSRKDDDK